MLSENAERRPSVLDNLQKQLDEAVLDMQLYGKALDVFEDDPATRGILHDHLLRTMGTPIVDKILFGLDKDNKLKNGMEFEDSEEQHVQLSTTERTFLAKDLPGQLSSKAQALVEALEGKRFDSFMDALRDTAEESGLLFKKLDERLEPLMLHSHRKDLIAQVSSETDPVSFLPKVVALLFLQAYNKALQAPGGAVGAVITVLKDKLPASTFKVLTEYHATTVKLLALQDAATGDEDDCTSDRMLEKKEDLEERLMPELKSLALGTSKEQSSTGGRVYLGTNGSTVEIFVWTASGHVGAGCGRPTMPLWRPETNNSGGGGGGCGCKAKGRRGRVEGNETGMGIEWARGVRALRFGCTDSDKPPSLCLQFMREIMSGPPRDRYRTALEVQTTSFGRLREVAGPWRCPKGTSNA
uniref:Uncharacterized protein n=1 Tax=Aegilops tauschii TaxID=37682 RepID=N1QWP7_AEGTA